MSAATVAVVDMAVSNVGSVANMLRRLGARVEVTSDERILAAADRIVLPGVGSFDAGSQHLATTGIAPTLRRVVVDGGVPLLGICLGMQLLAEASEEGVEPGLGWIPGTVRRLQPSDEGRPLPVPHMGWNTIERSAVHALAGVAGEEGRRYYFVHSFAFHCRRESDAVGTTSYGSATFTSMVAHANIVGVQFHPEKSHRHGMALLAEWLGI